MSFHCSSGSSSCENTAPSRWVLSHAFLLSLPRFFTLAHGLTYDAMLHRRLSPFSARAESWLHTSKRCFASITMLASQSQVSRRMHAFSGLSYPFFFNELAGELRYEHLSVYACSNFMRQQAMASKMVFNRPVPVNRLVSTIADSTSSPSHSLRVSSSRGGREVRLLAADAHISP
jgi:hypothetical protein